MFHINQIAQVVGWAAKHAEGKKYKHYVGLRLNKKQMLTTPINNGRMIGMWMKYSERMYGNDPGIVSWTKEKKGKVSGTEFEEEKFSRTTAS